MLGLPKSTEFNRRIPKNKFYEKLTISPALKRCFIDQIKIIYWANKIAATTANLAEGNNVTEIEVFRVKLNDSRLDEAVLKQIDREIPYHILFVLEYDGMFQAWIGYKEEAGSGKAAFKVDRYYHTDWMPEEKLPIKLEGLDIDSVYENFVRQVAGKVLHKPTETLKQSVERDAAIERLSKQIQQLQQRMRKERQLNRQMQIHDEIKKLRRKMEELSNG